MLLRILVLVGLAAPNAVFLAWLLTGFHNINAILNNSLATGFFLEMIAATFLLALFFKANPLGNVSVRWFVLFSLVGGAGPAIPAYYWLNKRARGGSMKMTASMGKLVRRKKERREKVLAVGRQHSLILNTHSV